MGGKGTCVSCPVGGGRALVPVYMFFFLALDGKVYVFFLWTPRRPIECRSRKKRHVWLARLPSRPSTLPCPFAAFGLTTPLRVLPDGIGDFVSRSCRVRRRALNKWTRRSNLNKIPQCATPTPANDSEVCASLLHGPIILPRQLRSCACVPLSRAISDNRSRSHGLMYMYMKSLWFPCRPLMTDELMLDWC